MLSLAHRMGRQAEHDGIGALHPIAREREIHARLSRQARQRIGRADIGKEADPDLGHGEEVALAGDPVGAVQGHTDPAAHDDAVDEGDIRLRDSA